MRARNTSSRSLQHATGEQLLLMAVFGSQQTRRVIDRELDRRARLRLANGSAGTRTNQAA